MQMSMLSTETREAIELRALEIKDFLDQRDGPYYAEIVPDAHPMWHLIETSPNNELKAAAFLADRRFGVFIPKFAPDVKMTVKGQNLCGTRRLMFPGHVLVFAWDIKTHWRRVKACPGVIRILIDRQEHPAVVPHDAVDFIYSLQFGWKNRKRKRYAGKDSTPAPRAERYLDGAEVLSEEQRNARLREMVDVAPPMDGSP